MATVAGVDHSHPVHAGQGGLDTQGVGHAWGKGLALVLVIL